MVTVGQPNGEAFKADLALTAIGEFSLIIALHRGPRDDVKTLPAELDHAQVVSPSEIPRNLITMNSRACLRDLETGDAMTYTLVFPKQLMPRLRAGSRPCETRDLRSL